MTLMKMTNFNAASVLSHIRRVCTPLDRVGRGSRPRQLHARAACSGAPAARRHVSLRLSLPGGAFSFASNAPPHARPVETPEGPACGLIKAFGLAARVTHHIPVVAQRRYREAIVALLAAPPADGDTGVYVLLNGDLVGTCPGDPEDLADRIRQLEDPGDVPYAVASVYVSACDGTVYVHTDEGRVVRPLLTVGRGRPYWERPPYAPGAVDAMLAAGVLRYIDAAEVSSLEVALDPGVVAARGGTVDVMEVHAHLMLGVTAALIPFIQANQSPRNAYQTSMGRQAVGAPLPPGPFELSPALCYAQKPLCPATVPSASLAATECGLPMGQNFMIAVLPYGGCNQNDSIVLNRQSVERGLGMSLSYHTRRFDVHPPYRLCGNVHPDVTGELGVVLPGVAIRPGSVMIAAATLDAGGAQPPMLRQAMADDSGMVFRVILTCGSEGYVLTMSGCYNLHSWSPVRLEHVRIGHTTQQLQEPITIRITTVALREPRIGDKFASRHGRTADHTAPPACGPLRPEGHGRADDRPV